jgi:hypothetical protein
MARFDAIVSRIFDAVFAPMRTWPPLASLALVSLLVAMALLLVIRATSNQAGIAAAKRRIWAGLFEIRLFNDDPRAILRAQADVLRHDFTYLRLSFVPMLWVLLPMLLLVAQLEAYYGRSAFRQGDTFLYEVTLRTAADNPSKYQAVPAPSSSPMATAAAPRPDVQLHLPEGLTAETDAAWIPSLDQIVWRVRADRSGNYQLEASVGTERYAKEVRVAPRGLARLSSERRAAGLWTGLLYPSEPPLGRSAPVRSLRTEYPPRGVAVLGWQVPWMIVFFVLVTLFALLLKNRFRVTF